MIELQWLQCTLGDAEVARSCRVAQLSRWGSGSLDHRVQPAASRWEASGLCADMQV